MATDPRDPAHFRGIPLWGKLTIIFLAIGLSSAAIGFGLLNAQQANANLAFSQSDAKIVEAVAGLAKTQSRTDQGLVVHTLNVIAHLKAITNNQSLATLAAAGGSALLAIGFSLFLIGSDGAFNLTYDGNNLAPGKLAFYATAPGLLCILLGALLIGLGSMRKHEFHIGDFPLQLPLQGAALPAIQPAPAAGASAIGASSWEILAAFCVDADLLTPVPAGAAQATGIVSLTGGNSRASAISARSDAWVVGTVVTVRFIDGDPALQARVRHHAEHVLMLAKGLSFQFTDQKDAMVRVSFKRSYSWSDVGRQVLSRREGPTMNLALKPADPDEKVRGLTYHAFGHVLALKHLHRPSEPPNPWDRERLAQFFAGAINPASSPSAADRFMERYDHASSPSAGRYDADSVMRMPIPAEIVANRIGQPLNTQLSAGDQQAISEMYPGPPVRK